MIDHEIIDKFLDILDERIKESGFSQQQLQTTDKSDPHNTFYLGLVAGEQLAYYVCLKELSKLLNKQ